MESQPQNPEFRNNPENFHPCFNDSPETKNYHHLSRFVEFGSQGRGVQSCVFMTFMFQDKPVVVHGLMSHFHVPWDFF